MLTSLPQPIIFAHRGASAHAPENTLAAFELALARSADAIELDVKLSADGRVVVIHDQTVDRTTGSRGRVPNLSFTQLRALDAAVFFQTNIAGKKSPCLRKFLKRWGNAPSSTWN